MSPTLHKILDGILIAVAIGFVIWVFIRAFQRSTNPTGLALQWLITLVIGIPLGVVIVRLFKTGFSAGGLGGAMVAIGGLFLTVVFGFIMAIIWRNNVIDLITSPIASLYDGGTEPPEPKPLYSAAISKRKSGRPFEAIVAVREQLAKFPDDFEGVTLLASIQAEDTQDLPGAEITFNHFCERKNAPPLQVAAALTQLADW